MDDEPSTKRCTKCDTVKPREAFSMHRTAPDGLRSACKACTSVQGAVYRATNLEKLKAQGRARYAEKRDEVALYRAGRRALVPMMEDLRARVAALEALLRKTPNGTVDRIAPERPRRKRAVHEHASQAPAVPSATPPIIRTIKDIVDHERVTAAEAKRIQEREILARAEWRPAGNA